MTFNVLFRRSVLSITTVFITTIHPVWAFENGALGAEAPPLLTAQQTGKPSFDQLLQGYIQQQPQQKTLAGLQQLQAAQKNQANSWIAGDVNLIVHHENDALTDSNDSNNWEVGVQFPIWLPSQKQGATELANISYQNLPIEQAYLNWLASGALRQLLWEYQVAQAEVEVTQDALSISEQLLATIQKQVSLGENPLIDGVLAEQAHLNHKVALIKQQADVDIAKQAYKKWTGFNELPESIFESKAFVDIEHHPEIQQLQAQLSLSKVGLKQIETQKSGQPSLYFGALKDRVQNQSDTSLVMEVAIPLGINTDFGVKKAEQQLQIQRQQASVDQAAQTIVLKQQQALQQLSQLQQSIELTNQQQVLAEQAFEMSLKAYKLGAIGVQSLLLIQQQANDSKRNAILAQHQFGQATANYNQISGDILGATNR